MRWCILVGLMGPMFSTFAFGKNADSLVLKGGIGRLDQGDDVGRPALVFEGQRRTLVGGFYLYGREFSGVEEQTIGLYGGVEKVIFDKLPIFARFGGSALIERTSIAIAPTTDETEYNYNLGAFVGLQGRVRMGRFITAGSIDSHLFLAGLNGGLLMATGRKHVISIMAGMLL